MPCIVVLRNIIRNEFSCGLLHFEIVFGFQQICVRRNRWEMCEFAESSGESREIRGKLCTFECSNECRETVWKNEKIESNYVFGKVLSVNIEIKSVQCFITIE